MLESLTEGVGLVIGSRVVGGSEEYTHIRALGNVFLSATLGLCTRRYLSDALNGFKVFRRDVFNDFDYTSRAFEIEIEIIANTLRKGYRVVEVSSHERARAGGVMKSNVIRHGTRFLIRILWEGLRGVQAPAKQVVPGFPNISPDTPTALLALPPLQASVKRNRPGTSHPAEDKLYNNHAKGLDPTRTCWERSISETEYPFRSWLRSPILRTMAVSVRFYFRFRKRAKAPASQTHISLHRGRARGSSRFRNRASL